MKSVRMMQPRLYKSATACVQFSSYPAIPPWEATPGKTDADQLSSSKGHQPVALTQALHVGASPSHLVIGPLRLGFFPNGAHNTSFESGGAE